MRWYRLRWWLTDWIKEILALLLIWVCFGLILSAAFQVADALWGRR